MVAAAVDDKRGLGAGCQEVVHLYPAVRWAESPRYLGPEAGARRPKFVAPTSRLRRPFPACRFRTDTRMAGLTRHFSLIRSMTHVGNISNHFDAMHHCLSGQADAPADSPYMGSILAKVRPRKTASLRTCG